MQNIKIILYLKDMEWIYIIGLIGYYLYKAYNKGIENSTNNNKPIKKIERKQEKNFGELIKDLLEQTEAKQAEMAKTQAPKPVNTPKKEQQKPVVKSKPLTPNSAKRSEEPILHEHDVFNASIEYDNAVENIFHKRYDSVESKGSHRIEAIEDENYAVGRRNKAFKGLLVDGRLLSAKEMLIAQTVFERKF